MSLQAKILEPLPKKERRYTGVGTILDVTFKKDGIFHYTKTWSCPSKLYCWNANRDPTIRPIDESKCPRCQGALVVEDIPLCRDYELLGETVTDRDEMFDNFLNDGAVRWGPDMQYGAISDYTGRKRILQNQLFFVWRQFGYLGTLVKQGEPCSVPNWRGWKVSVDIGPRPFPFEDTGYGRVGFEGTAEEAKQWLLNMFKKE